eukprot:COSAG02_NODE_2877_length_7842_cov_3.566060_4_plen_521_part_00
MASPRWVDPGPDPFDFSCPLRSCLPKVPAYLRMAAMISCTLLIDLCNSSACIAIAGRIFSEDPKILAGVTVGSMLFNICLLSTSYGMASGLDTLLAQAHGAVLAGVKRREHSWPGAAASPLPPHPGRAHVRWTVLLLFLVWVPLGSLCVFSDKILEMVGQPVEVSLRAGSFARVLTVAAGVPLVCRTVQGKIINTARVTWPPLLGSCAGSVAHALFLYALYNNMDTDSVLPSNGGSSSSASGDSSGSALFDKIAEALGWEHEDAFLGAALGRAVYAITSVIVTGLYLVLSRNPICPTGCCVSFGGDSTGHSGGGRKQTTSGLLGGHLGSRKSRRSGVVGDLHAPLNSPVSDPRSEFGQEADGLQPDVTSSPIRTRSFNDDGSRPAARTGSAGLCLVMSLAVPSMLSMVAEWWAAEFRGLIAGWIDSTPPAPQVPTIMAANGVVFMFTVVFYQIPKGLGIASSVRCGNALGAGVSSTNASTVSVSAAHLCLVPRTVRRALLPAQVPRGLYSAFLVECAYCL